MTEQEKIKYLNSEIVYWFILQLIYMNYIDDTVKWNGHLLLPFNKGSNGAGNVGGKRNPYAEDDYQSTYLWKEVLVKDCLLEISHKYMYLSKEEETDEKVNTYTK